MDRRMINTLFLDDEDMNCNCSQKSLEDISIIDVGFGISVLNSFSLIIYRGSKGTKILKSEYTKTGVIK